MTEADKRLLELSSSDNTTDIEIIKPSQEEVIAKYFGVAEKTEKPLTDLDIAICTALGSGGKTEADIIDDFGVSKKYIAQLNRNKEARKFIKEMVNLRLDLVKADAVGIITSGMNYQGKKIMELLSSKKDSDRNLGMAYLFGKKSFIESASELEKMKSQEEEATSDVKDFFNGLLEASKEMNNG